MIIAIKAIFSIFMPTLLGWQLLHLLNCTKKFNVITCIAISYGLGAGLLTQLMLLVGALGIPYKWLAFIVCTITAVMFLLLLAFKPNQTNKGAIQAPLYLVEKKSDSRQNGISMGEFVLNILFKVYIAYLMLIILYIVFRIPIYTWDSLATSVYNAKVIFYEGKLININYLAYPVYPLNMPFLLVWVSTILGSWDDQLIKIIFPVFYLSFTVIFHNFLLEYTNRRWAKFGIFMLFSSNLLMYHVTIAYRDVILMYYTCLTVIFLLLWQDKKDFIFLLLASLFAGFATFTKLEGTTYLTIHVLFFLYMLLSERGMRLTAKIKNFIVFMLPCSSIFAFYYCYKLSMGVSTIKYMHTTNWPGMLNITHVISKLLGHLFLNANWNLIWLLLIFSLSANIKKVLNTRMIHLLFISVVLFVGLYFTLPMVLSGMSTAIMLAMNRLFMHTFPLVPLLIVFLNHKEIGKEKAGEV